MLETRLVLVEVVMTIRRTIPGTVAIVALGTSLGITPGIVSAQSSTTPQKPATAVIAGIARAPEAPRDRRIRDRDNRSERPHDRDGDRRDGDGIRVGHVFFGPEVPVVIGSDGHVYANFGYGFQPVLQNCATAQFPSLRAAPAPAPTVQPRVTQPVVVQPGSTPSVEQQASGSVARLGEAPSTMCWATDERGQLRVGRR
jgi:hypothetical protein